MKIDLSKPNTIFTKLNKSINNDNKKYLKSNE